MYYRVAMTHHNTYVIQKRTIGGGWEYTSITEFKSKEAAEARLKTWLNSEVPLVDSH